jgi:proline dehydrogenase
MLRDLLRPDPQSLLRRCWLPLVKRAARAYVAGPDLSDALRVSEHLASRGFSTTLGFRNREQARPQQTATAYCAALEALARSAFDCYLSVKAPALAFASELFARVSQQAQQHSVRIHVDALSLEAADPTFKLLEAVRTSHTLLGCTLPARWRRSLTDVDWAIQHGAAVRVVKGQWADAETWPVDLCAAFLALVDRLAGRACSVAVATHDPPLAREALLRLRAAGTPCALELLLGLPARSLIRVARELEIPVRFYVPYGEAWPPYQLSQVRQNPRIYWWFCRDLLFGCAFRLPSQSPLSQSRESARPGGMRSR